MFGVDVSDDDSWKFDCSGCKQTWHAACVGLRGLNILKDYEIELMLDWKCPVPMFCLSSENTI